MSTRPSLNRPNPRALFISNVYPLPTDDGTKMRVLHLANTVSSVADVDFFTLGEPDESRSLIPAGRVEGMARRDTWRRTPSVRWLYNGLPQPWATRDTTPGRERLREWERGPYDLVFYNRLDTYLTFGVFDAPIRVLDFDALHSERLLTELISPSGPRGLRRVRDRLDVSRWERLEREIARGMDLSLFCTAADVTRLNAKEALVVPNGFPDESPVGRPSSLSDPPLVGFVGAFSYGPNHEAAERLVTEIMPKVHAISPHARCVLVGKDGRLLEHLGTDRPWLEITGTVDSVLPWLEKIDVLVMPVTRGGGTRLKVLEALCHRVPVVAHPFTVSGHGLTHGKHLLVGPNAASMAQAVGRLLADTELRVSLADAGRRRFLEAHTWEKSTEELKVVLGDLLKR